jgi:hypothetical protein
VFEYDVITLGQIKIAVKIEVTIASYSGISCALF